MQEVKVSLSRELDLLDIVTIGIAGMIGAGIFALTGIASGIAGPAILLAFLFNGIISTLTGLSYAELGSAIPQAGGGYVWIKEAFGEYMGFIAGWCDWLAHSVACSLYAVTFGAFFSEFLVKFMGLNISQKIISLISSLIIVTLLAYVNYKGVKETGRIGNVVTLTKVVILVVFALFGIYKTLIKPDWTQSFTPFMPNGWVGVLSAMGLTFIAFEGYEIIVQSGEEVKNPEKNIPKAIIISLWIVVTIYIMTAFALIGAIDVGIPSWVYLGKLKEFSMIRIANLIMPFGSILILVGGLVSTISAMNATIYSSSRVVFGLSRDYYLPRFLSRINKKTMTPHYAIFFSYVIIAIMSLLPIETVASASDIMFLILFIMVNATVIVLRYKRPDLKRAYKVPLLVLPFMAIILQMLIGYYLIAEIGGLTVLEITMLWILMGSLIYFAYSEKEIIRKVEEEAPTVYEEFPIKKGKFTILVPVANPKFAGRLIEFAEKVAKVRNGEIIVLNVVTLPGQTPLSAEVEIVERAKEFVHNLLTKINVPSGGIVKIGHRASDAILNVVNELKPDLTIIGWRGRTFRKDYILGSTIDPILLKAKCDVLVVKFGEEKKMDKILVPTAGGIHATLSAEIAKCLAEYGNAEITLLYVGKDESKRKVAEKAFDSAEKILKGVKVKKLFVVAENTIEKIVEIAKDYDLIVIGATSRHFLKNFLMGVFPEKIAKKTNKTVVMARKYVRLKDMIKIR